MKCIITGHTSGLGKHIYNHFNGLGWTVVGFNRTTGLDQVVDQAQGCDLFINNAYADGIQIELLNQLYNRVDKMIVCGSVVTDYPDVALPKYTADKQQLEQRLIELNQPNILLLKLSGQSYNDTELVLRTIDFWLSNPRVSVISFYANGEPNR
jgi:hypothetical protein